MKLYKTFTRNKYHLTEYLSIYISQDGELYEVWKRSDDRPYIVKTYSDDNNIKPVRYLKELKNSYWTEITTHYLDPSGALRETT